LLCRLFCRHHVGQIALRKSLLPTPFSQYVSDRTVQFYKWIRWQIFTTLLDTVRHVAYRHHVHTLLWRHSTLNHKLNHMPSVCSKVTLFESYCIHVTWYIRYDREYFCRRDISNLMPWRHHDCNIQQLARRQQRQDNYNVNNDAL